MPNNIKRKPTPEERIAILATSGIPKTKWGVFQNMKVDNYGSVFAELHMNALTPESRKKWKMITGSNGE